MISLIAVSDNSLALEDKSIEDALKTIEAFYHQKDYQNALKTLESQRADLDPAIWHYNMGTVLGKSGEFALARFHFLMAEANGYISRELTQNKNLVEEKLDVQKYENPLGLQDYAIKAGLFAANGLFTTIALSILIVGIWTLWKKSNWKTFAIISVAGIIFGLMTFWVNSWEKRITISEAIIQEGPSAIFPSKGEIPKGILIITEKKGNWLKVIYPSRFSGWIKETGLKELK